MSSLIANQIKTYMCLVLMKLCLLFALLMCHCSNLYMYTTIIITITTCVTQLFVICLQPFCKSHLYLHKTTMFKHATYFQTAWIITVSFDRFVQPFILPHLTNERSRNGRFLFAPSREVYRDRLYMCIPMHVIIQ